MAFILFSRNKNQKTRSFTIYIAKINLFSNDIFFEDINIFQASSLIPSFAALIFYKGASLSGLTINVQSDYFTKDKTDIKIKLLQFL